MLELRAKCKGAIQDNTKIGRIGLKLDPGGGNCDVDLATGFPIVEVEHCGYRLLPANFQAPFLEVSTQDFLIFGHCFFNAFPVLVGIGQRKIISVAILIRLCSRDVVYVDIEQNWGEYGTLWDAIFQELSVAALSIGSC